GDRLLEAHEGNAEPVPRGLRPRSFRRAGGRPRPRRGARARCGSDASAAPAGGPLQARRPPLLREEAPARRREIRSLGTRMAGDAGKIALEATGVRKAYAKNGVSLQVIEIERFVAREGEFITVIGPSGCGKSTFLHILGGFIPADQGAIRVYGDAV